MLGSSHERILQLVLALSRDFASMFVTDLSDDMVVTGTSGKELTESPPQQLRADGVIVVGDPPILGIIVESQTSMDAKDYADKTLKWPHYAIGLRTELKCPTLTLVVTPDPKIESSARQSIDLGGGNLWRPFVIGPSDMPKSLTREFAREHPGLALLTVILRGPTYTTIDEPAAVLQAVAESKSAHTLEKGRQQTYYDLVLRSLALDVARSLRDDEMTQQFYSQALMEVLNEGIEQGIEAGRVDGLRVSLRTCLEARGYVPSTLELQRIQEESDLLVLQSWLKKAVVMEPGQSIFDPH